MKLPVNLQESLAQNPEAIAATSTLIAQQMVILDATGIDSLDAEQLEQILGNIPKTWNFNQLKTIFNADTVSESLELQLIKSFLEIRDRPGANFVRQELEKGYLWQAPLVWGRGKTNQHYR